MIEPGTQQETLKEVTVRYEVKFAEMLKVNFWSLIGTTYGRVMLLMPCVASLFLLKMTFDAIPSVDSSFEGFLIVVLILMTLVLAGLTPIITYFWTLWYLSHLKEFQRHLTFTLSARGVEVRDGKSFSHLDWEGVFRVYETNDSFNIFLNRFMFQYIPKKYFDSPEDAGLIREIFVENLGSRAKVAPEG